MSETKQPSLENIIKTIVKDEMNNIERKNVDEIVGQLIPEIDKLISFKLKEHLKSIAYFMINKMKEE